MLSTWEVIAVFAVAIIAYIPITWALMAIANAARKLIAKLCYWL